MSAEPKTGGDDLDDGLELDPSLMASDDEGAELGEDEGAYLSDEEEAPEPVSRKRKAADSADSAEPVSEEQAKKDAKKRRREKDKARKAAKRAAEYTEPADPSTLSTEEFAQTLLASLRSTFPAGTAMEIEDRAIPTKHLLPPLMAVDGEGSDPLKARLTDALRNAPKKPTMGTPRVLILSLSGIRCADVVRAVRDVPRPGGEIAKHFKVADQVKFLGKTRVAIAVGTPARVAKLLEEGALKITPQTVVILDIGHRDAKNRTMLSLPEVRDEFWKSLLANKARRALLDGGAHFAAV
ncbi:hypothetical protein A1Q2_06259 [Trichosporon asahii var. asahii CBS 8904]|uniref:Protein CMS1 n=2 Tax=Trichosporon asahii var. asahii TaxID=189963 RepID=K1VRI8_TRIAC|nr:hypothetical protein A1Q1_02883 [Trichosporon asahii var. asahii CBS 2479]EJT48179.1 hypothetical protein A1Q1_02883 [Trichosporon asahii var. asahii CBS 2479]EKC99322.1 hypothetical protein A1Q2_06259 [Trichosporon asahii var. asahii CBS 8904]